MRVFISYSINDQEQYLLTLLSSKFRQDGFSVVASENYYSNVVDYHTSAQISKSHLFVGVITGDGVEHTRVIEEWRYAKRNNIPNLLLIEDTVPVDYNFRGNFIHFNRYDPEPAVARINEKQRKAKQTSGNNDAWAWVLGGAALLAIISMLSGGDKK